MSEDKLLDTITAAVDKAEANAGGTGDAPPGGDASDAPPAAAPDKTAEPAAGARPRAEDGKFVAAEKAKPVAAEKKSVAPAETATGAQAQATTPGAKPETAIAAPQAWKGNGKVEWQRLPRHVQQAIADDYSRITNTESELSRYKSAIGDRAQVLAATYGSVEQGIQNLFAISDMATKNPAGFVQWFAQQRGINLAQLVHGGQQPNGAQQQPQGGIDPSDPYAQRLMQLENTIQQQQQFLQQQIQQQQQAVTSQLQADINSFANNPEYPFFNDVRDDMAALLANGRAKDLPEAYGKAVWANPDIRTQLIAKEREAVIGENAAKIANARKAAGSLTGSPAGAQVPSDTPKRNLEDTIRASVERAMGG